jgi:vacuolar-type H+-ATPase subunit D/Vma8
MREKVEAEARPRMDVEFIKGSREITEEWKEEVFALRAQVDKVREDYERRLTVWMDRAMSAEKQIPRLEAEILMLKARVAYLEKQITGGPPVANPPG